jgi:hypothetical protein
MQRLRILLGLYQYDGEAYSSPINERTSESSTGTSFVTIPQTIVGNTVVYPWRKSSKLRFETNFSIRLQAFSTSNSNFFRLRCSIQRHLAFFHRFLEIWIVDYLGFYEIYRRVKKLLEPLNQEKIVLGVFHRWHRLELHQKIKVSHFVQCRFPSGATEKVQPLHSKSFAEGGNFSAQIENFLIYDGKLYQNPTIRSN